MRKWFGTTGDFIECCLHVCPMTIKSVFCSDCDSCFIYTLVSTHSHTYTCNHLEIVLLTSHSVSESESESKRQRQRQTHSMASARTFWFYHFFSEIWKCVEKWKKNPLWKNVAEMEMKREKQQAEHKTNGEDIKQHHSHRYTHSHIAQTVFL